MQNATKIRQNGHTIVFVHPPPLYNDSSPFFTLFSIKTFYEMIYSSFANAADNIPSSRLGKIRGVHLPTEYELEKLIRGVQNPHSSWSANTPACEWHEVTCNEEGDVTRIEWSGLGLRGTLDWKHIPKTAKYVDVMNNEIEGTLELSALPRELEKFWAGENKLSGSLQFCDLPPTLEILNLSENYFTGHADLSCLPSELRGMNISGNKGLRGTVHTSNLSETLTYRCVRNTKITFI